MHKYTGKLLLLHILFIYLIVLHYGTSPKYQQTVYANELYPGFCRDFCSGIVCLYELACAIDEAPFELTVNRFDKENTLIIVENISESMKLFPLSEEGGNYMFDKSGEEISLINR